MDQLKELTIVTPNKPGKLAQALRAVARAKVNLVAMDSSSGYDLNMVRLVADNPQRAKQALEKLNYSVSEATVLAVTVADKPGQLARISSVFARQGINIDYMYASACAGGKQALVIFHVSDLAAAERVLKAEGFS